MKKSSKWTDEKLREIYDWRIKNNASLDQMVKHFGETKSAISQAFSKAKKRFAGTSTKRKYTRSTLPALSTPKRAQVIDLEVPDETQRQPMVAVAIMPMSNLAELVRGLNGNR